MISYAPRPCGFLFIRILYSLFKFCKAPHRILFNCFHGKRFNFLLFLSIFHIFLTEFFLQPVDGIAHHVGRDEMTEVIVDDGLGLDVIALGQFFQIEFLGSPIDDIIGAAAEGQEGPAAETVHVRIGIHDSELHLDEVVRPGLFNM